MIGMKFNLHTHTTRCNHATGEDREYVESAIKAGMKVLGFADHCPQFFPGTDYYSFFRMVPELAAEYAASIRTLQREYKDDIKILLGFETEYYPKTFDAFMEFIRPLHLDYLIMGQHFIGNEFDENSYYAGSSGKTESYLNIYVKQVKEGLDKGVFTYLAHPDIVWYQGGMAYYERKMTELCKYALKKDIPLEFNILGYLNGRCYPNPAFWNIAGKVGNKAVIGYDAHNPEMLLRDDLLKKCQDLMKTCGVNETPFEEIKLRNENL